MCKTIDEILRTVQTFEVAGLHWFPLQEIAAAMGVAPQKITKLLPSSEKTRRTIGRWPMQQAQYGISPAGLVMVWRVYGKEPIHKVKAAVLQ